MARSEPRLKPCLRSGYCCKKAPCGFGRWSADGTQCEFLTGDGPGSYECGIYDYVVNQTGNEVAPAFGAGCCSPLNTDRRALEVRMVRSVETSCYRRAHGRPPRGRGNWAFYFYFWRADRSTFGSTFDRRTEFAPANSIYSDAKRWAIKRANEIDASHIIQVAP